jgi:hypothetical protein
MPYTQYSLKIVRRRKADFQIRIVAAAIAVSEIQIP